MGGASLVSEECGNSTTGSRPNVARHHGRIVVDWYRAHDLLREVLLARLQASEPARVPKLHRRAAEWYAAQGDDHEAITHALAAELIACAAPQLWLCGDV
jgi:hypothetical protein